MFGCFQIIAALMSVFIAAVIASQNNCTAPQMTSLLYIYRTKKGVTSTQTWYKSGDWLFFRCKNNGQLVGSPVRSCRSGSWSGTQPRCIAKSTPAPQVRCRKLRNLKNGKIRGKSRRANSVVRFSCNAGYNIMGPRKLTCLSTGKWSGSLPRCLKDISCPHPGTPGNGSLLGTKFKYGRRVQYSCNTGYKLVGSVSRKCMSTGRWSGQQTKCVKIDPALELKEVADNLRKNLVNKFSLVTVDSRARAGISSGAAGLDFVFILDSSASVGKTNFKRGIQFVQTIIREYGVTTKPQGTRVAIVTFNAAADIRFNLATNVMNDTDQAMKELGNIHFQGGGTNTEAALSKVFHEVAPEARKRTHKVIFLITDGRSNAGTNPRDFARRLRERNYEIFAIGITKNADKDELKSIASQPYRSHIHLFADYATLEKLKDMITKKGVDEWECGQAGNTGLRGDFKTPNRKLAKDDAWPWQAAIYVDAAFKCGGALVADNWVLTAASCFDRNMFKDLKGHNIAVILGDHNRLEQGGTEQNHVGAKIVRPPKSGKNGRDDIAMIKLKDSIKQTAYAHAVCYDEDPASALIWPTEYGVVTGWGSRKQRKKNATIIPANDEVQQAVIRFASDRDCRERSNIKNLKGNVFCGSSQDDTVDECLGDNGGPVVVKLIDDSWTLVGVMKVNEGCAADLKYSLFTKVGHYSKWIAKTILNN